MIKYRHDDDDDDRDNNRTMKSRKNVSKNKFDTNLLFISISVYNAVV